MQYVWINILACGGMPDSTISRPARGRIGGRPWSPEAQWHSQAPHTQALVSSRAYLSGYFGSGINFTTHLDWTSCGGSLICLCCGRKHCPYWAARTDRGVLAICRKLPLVGALNLLPHVPLSVQLAPVVPPPFSQSTSLMQKLPKLTTFKGSSSASLKSRILHLKGRMLGPLLSSMYFGLMIQMTKINASWSHGSFDFKHEVS